MIRKLFPYVGEYKIYAILAPVTMVFEVLLEVAIPYIMSLLVNYGVNENDMGYIVKMGSLMIVCALLSLLSGALSARFSAIASTGFAKNLRGSIYNKIQDFSFKNIDKFSTSSLITRLTKDVTNAQHLFMMCIRMLVRSPLMFVSAVIMTVNINPSLSLVFLTVTPLMIITLLFIVTRAHPRFERMLKRYDKLNSVVQENLISIRVVKAFVRGEYEEEKFADAAEQVRETQRKAERIVIFNMPVMQLCMYICTIAIFWLGGNQIIGGTMLSGDLISFISYVSQILMSLMTFSMIFVMFVVSRASIQRICEVLEEDIDIKDPENGITEVTDGSIEFKNVSFGYYGDRKRDVLKSIDLKIEAGKTVGIIGATGSSKTSLVQLIPRLYDVSEGEVLVGGKNVKEYNIKALRDSVAMVLQKNVLFSGTIADNLRWGDRDASYEEIKAVCKVANADTFIESFENGYGSDLSQGGVNVSGGQKQRLCIARALLKKPKILILDDSMSAVDTATDRSIRDNLKSAKAYTTIIIAQRVSSISDADMIIVMDKGRIVDTGTHDELLEKSDIYREVYESQKKGRDE